MKRLLLVLAVWLGGADLGLRALHPTVALHAPAHAAEDQDDDEREDDEDDDDDDGDDRARPPPNYLRSEIVLHGVSARDIGPLQRAGFGLISRTRLSLLDGEIVRLRAPRGLSERQALGRALRIAPHARGDFNHLYRPQQAQCAGRRCATARALNWPTNRSSCGAGLSIALIDTRVDAAHPALRGQGITLATTRARGRSAASAEHGTAIASLIVGRTDGPAPGLAPRARVLAIDAFHADARGNAQADAVDLAAALDAAARARAPVVNLSLAGPPNTLIERAIAALTARGIIVVAAVGNEARAQPRFPAAYPGVVAITAVDDAHRLYRLANTGAHVDFAAPGVNVWAAAPGAGARAQSGTSFAAAAASVVIAHAQRRSGKRGLAELQRTAIDLGPRGRDARSGWGLLQSGGRCR